MELRYNQKHHAGKLYQELIAALPTLAPEDTALGPVARVLVQSGGDVVVLTVPESVSVAAIDAVLAAHDPNPPLPVPSAEEAAENEMAAANSVAALRAAMVRYLRAKRGVSA